MKLIDKDALIAETERLEDAIKATAIDDRISKEQAEAYKVCVKIRYFVEDILEEIDDEQIRKRIIQSLHGDVLDIEETNKAISWLENQCKAKENKDSLNNQDKDERLMETTIAFLREYADKGYENAVECIDWLKKQDKQKSVWHDENEEPIRGSFILLIMQDGTPTVAKVIESNQTIDQGERWAYIDDLLKK